jgi:hypothetical protein
MNNTTRLSRTQETRAADDIHEDYQDEWETPELLDTANIPARPGYVQRWVRTKVKAEDDQVNVFRKINQGWKPRTMDSVEKGQYIPNIDFQGTNVVGIHGMILMERPEAQHRKHMAYNANMTRNQIESVKQNVFNVHTEGNGMVRPSIKMKSEVHKGRPIVPDDDE